MKLIDFLNLHKIHWRPIDEIFYSQKKGDYIMIDTNQVNQLDIDEPCPLMHELIDKLPYFESNTKKLPHFFCHLESKRALIGCLPDCKVDVLTGIPTYALRDTIVHNARLPIGRIKFPN